MMWLSGWVVPITKTMTESWTSRRNVQSCRQYWSRGFGRSMVGSQISKQAEISKQLRSFFFFALIRGVFEGKIDCWALPKAAISYSGACQKRPRNKDTSLFQLFTVQARVFISWFVEVETSIIFWVHFLVCQRCPISDEQNGRFSAETLQKDYSIPEKNASLFLFLVLKNLHS